MRFPIDRDSVLRPARDAAWREVGGEMIVLDVSGRMVRGLNATGALTWELLDGRRSVSEVARVLAEETGAPEERVLADVCAFVVELADMGLLEPATG